MDELTPEAGSPASVELSYEGAVLVVALAGELDLSSSEQVRQVIDRALPEQAEAVVIDLSRLEFMDSSGIALLLTVAGRVRRVELRRPSAVVRQVIEITGLAGTLVIVP